MTVATKNSSLPSLDLKENSFCTSNNAEKKTFEWNDNTVDHKNEYIISRNNVGNKRIEVLPEPLCDISPEKPRRQEVRNVEPQDGSSNQSSVLPSPSSIIGTQQRKKLNVLIVTPVFPPFVSVGGGVAITYGALTDKLKSRGHTVSVLSPRLENVDRGTTNLYLGFPVILATFTNLKLLDKHYKAADVVVCPDNNLLPFLIFLSYWNSTPLLYNTHTNFKHLLERGSWISKYFAAPLMDENCKLFTHLATETWTTSPSYKDVLINRGYNIYGVFSPRIKLSVFEKEDEIEDILKTREWLKGGVQCDYIFITASRWSHEKRIPLLAQNLPSNCCLCIFGDGPDQEADIIIKLHNPSKRVFVHRGMVNQDRLRVLYKASDFLVSASAFETLGMTVCEAHLCGTPAIVQTAPGFISQVVEGENGFLVDYEDPNVCNHIIQCVKNKPSKNQIQKTIDGRWDSSLPNLEDVVENVSRKNKSSEWNNIGSRIPVLLWIPFVMVFYIIYRIASYPFVVAKEKRKTYVTDPAKMHLSQRLC